MAKKSAQEVDNTSAGRKKSPSTVRNNFETNRTRKSNASPKSLTGQICALIPIEIEKKPSQNQICAVIPVNVDDQMPQS